jgi:hypothetical protein
MKLNKVKLPKKIKSKNELLFNKCEKLWREIIYLRAGNVSEISGKSGTIQAHHVNGKSNYALRFDTRNGIALLVSEHIYGIHSGDRKEVKHYEELINAALVEREGKGILEKLDMIGNVQKADLFLISLDLESQIKRLRNIL